MRGKSKVKVMVRDVDGNESFATFETESFRDFRMEDLNIFKRQLEQRIYPVEDAILYTVRTVVDGKKNNWKCKTIGALDNVLFDVFGGEAF